MFLALVLAYGGIFASIEARIAPQSMYTFMLVICLQYFGLSAHGE